MELSGRHLNDNKWPPKGLLKIPREGNVILVTTGVSLRPQPNIELYIDDPRPFRRIELGVVLRGDTGEGLIEKFARFINGQSGLPWRQFTWLSHGHSIRLNGFDETSYKGVLLANSRFHLPHVELPTFDEDPVTLLWMIPVTGPELETAKKIGSDSIIDKTPYPR